MKKIVALLFIVTALFAETRFLMPDEAFIPSAETVNGSRVDATLKLGDQIYIYKDQFGFEIKGESPIHIKTVDVSNEAVDHEGERVYLEDVKAVIDFTKSPGAKEQENIVLVMKYQGCSEAGLCYEPSTKEFALTIDTASLVDEANAEEVIEPGSLLTEKTAQDDGFERSETDAIVDALKGGSIWSILVVFFGIGVVLSLTPCIFPMIPILSSIIVSQGEGISAKRGFLLSLVYVLAMAVAYSLAGVLAGIFGENLQVLLQNEWAIGGFALVFVALALSMFGFYEIGLPASWQSKLSSVSDEASNKGGFVGVAIMGFLSALIVGPCVAPGLAGALIYIGQTGNAVLGGTALFVMSIGMGLPLLLIGIGAGKFMPRPGGWMDTLTHAFGAVMLAIAIWMLSRILPDTITMLLWAIFFMFSAVYMGALEPLEAGKRGWHALTKAIGVLFMVYGALLFTGALSGSTSMFTPLDQFTKNNSAVVVVEEKGNAFEVIHSSAELDAILDANRDKTVMLDFSAAWCSSCKEMEHITFADAAVRTKMQEFVLVQADVTANSAEEKALTKRFGLFGPPGILFFKNGEEVKNARIIGYQPPEKFLAHLNRL
ncbi:protein-disulfide reductase DsbD [Sulfurimonas sp. HSL3-7]|uniref:protein-disulfide reductase DsbD n=1 Tax=Sulfonitrofixus jiaomeiensis TaxID=3131938 RepID=UPI0031F7F782